MQAADHEGLRAVAQTADVLDLRRLVAWLPGAQVLHVHRGKEHWLAALANRMSNLRRPLIRTRHIVQPVRPHALNRWLYGRATDQVVTVTEAIRRQLVAGGLGVEHRVVTMHASDRYLSEGTIEDLRKEEDSVGYAKRLRHGEIGKGLNDVGDVRRLVRPAPRPRSAPARARDSAP